MRLRASDAETLATFTGGALAGWPAVTRRSGDGGGGAAWYVATVPEPEALRRLAERVLAEADVDAPAPAASGSQVEVVRRGDVVVVINHGPDDATVAIEGSDLLSGAAAPGLVLPSQGVAVIRE
jgi:beta-galactosidase